MPINRISGNILQDDLVRGANLSFQGNLLTIDVVNSRVGVNTSMPQDSFEVVGNVRVANIVIASDGNIIMGNGWINNLEDPVEAQDAATKNYVDNQISSGFTIQDDQANTTVVAVGDTLELLGTPDQVTVAITAVDQVTFGLPTDVVISGNISTANVLTNAISGGNIVIWGNSVDFQLVSNITVSGSLIRDLGDPLAAQDAATKQYVDDAVSTGITIHTPVLVESPDSAGSYTATYTQGGNVYTVTDTVAANTVVFSTAANLQVNDQLWFQSSFDGIVANLAYFVVSTPNTSAAVLSTAWNGAPVANITGNTGLSQSVRVNSGQGATLTNAGANVTLVIDGVTMTGGERVLIYNQTNGAENGVYVVTVAGDAGNAWVLTRATDMDTYRPDDITGVDAGDYFFVQAGDTGAGESYVMTAPTGPLIIGLDPLTFTQFSASQVYSANTNAGLRLDGTVFSAKTDGDTTYFDVGGNIAVRPGANLVTPNIGNATGNSLTLSGNGLISAANVSISGNLSASGVVANVSGVTAVFSNSVTATQAINAGNVTATGWINAGGGNIWSSAAQVDLFTGGPTNQDIYIGSVNSLQTTIISPVISLDGGTAVLVNSPLSVESGGEAEIYTTASTARIFETGATTANVLLAGTNITIGATTGNTRIRNLLTVGGNLVANAVTSNTSISAQTGAFSGNVSANTFLGNASGTTGSFTGNVTANNVSVTNTVAGTTGSFTGNVTANNVSVTNDISAQTGTFSGNITAATFIGNIQGNIDAGGANTQVQFNDDDVLAGSPAFTFDRASNVVTVTGNVTADWFLGNVQGTAGNFSGTVTAGNFAGTQSNVELVAGAYTWTFDDTGNTTMANGTVSATTVVVSGNVSGGNVSAQGTVTATGNVQGGNIVSQADVTTVTVTASGNITGANVNASGQITATGNVQGGNLSTSGTVSASTGNFSGNLAAGNVNVQDLITATEIQANIQGTTASFSGNVQAQNITANAAIDAVTVSASGNVSGGNVNAGNSVSAATITATGNVTAGYFIGNIDGSTGNFSGNVTADYFIGNIDGTTGVFSGNVTANTFFGDLVGNITGNIDAGGANTTVQFNDDDVLAGSTAFTFDKVSNTVAVTGNVTAQEFLGNVQGDTVDVDTALTVLGTTDLGNIANVTITGGANLQYIQTDGTGNLTYATPGTAANVLYVSKSGNDANDGLSLDTAKLTIAAAVAIATTNTCIFVKSGDYTEVNPITVPTRVSIIGDNLRTVSVRPQTTNQDLFHLNQACYLTGMTFRDHVSPAAAVAFPTAGAGVIVTSPYVQNCSSITTTGCGMRVDGNLASGLRSMVTDSYTQFNQGGIGIEITNQGYAQLVSIFTICCSEGIRCSNGGTCSITNSNSSFGTYGLVADGVGPVLYTGNVISTTRSTATIGNLSQRPAVNDAFIFSGQTQYQLVRSATPLVANVSVVTFEETLEATPAPNDGVDFQQISLISASSHTFEYVGTGTNILTATPRLGGIPIQANEVREVGGGRVNYTSTDQFGDFRIGGGLVIKEEAGIIEGVTFDRSLFAVMTPYILALEG